MSHQLKVKCESKKKKTILSNQGNFNIVLDDTKELVAIFRYVNVLIGSFLKYYSSIIVNTYKL